jgi:hypothetical protein
LSDATRLGDVSGYLPVGIHVTGDLGIFHHLTGAFRWRRRRCRRRGWRTGTATEQHQTESRQQRKTHAFPRIVHRMTRDKRKKNSRRRACKYPVMETEPLIPYRPVGGECQWNGLNS